MSSSRHGGASDLSVNNLEFFEDRIHKSKDLCIYPTPAYFNNIHKMPIASDCEERMVEESPMIYIGEEDLYMIWCGWNFTREEWLWHLADRKPISRQL